MRMLSASNRVKGLLSALTVTLLTTLNGYAQFRLDTLWMHADKGTSVGYKKSAAWGKSHPL